MSEISKSVEVASSPESDQDAENGKEVAVASSQSDHEEVTPTVGEIEVEEKEKEKEKEEANADNGNGNKHSAAPVEDKPQSPACVAPSQAPVASNGVKEDSNVPVDAETSEVAESLKETNGDKVKDADVPVDVKCDNDEKIYDVGEATLAEKHGEDKEKDAELKVEENTVEPMECEEAPTPAPAISSRRESYNRNVYIMLDVNHREVEPKDIVEYEWPLKSGDRWFLQEQIGELLNIKSFSRKYPHYYRRKVNSEEREYLERIFGVHKLLNETSLRDMNAMRSSEIQDMMQNDYADIFMEYKKVVGQREKEIQEERAREMVEIKNDAVKYAELRRTCLDNVVSFNKDLNFRRRTERKGFWDIQTNIIQTPRNRWKVMKPEASKPGRYPAKCIKGQFHDYYKEFTPEELRRLPLGTVTDTEYLYALQREPSPPPLTIAVQDLVRVQKEEALKAYEASRGIVKKESTSQPLIAPDRECDSCRQVGGEMIGCTACEIVYHTACIEMPERMVRIVKTYEWTCVDCRVCSICNKPEQEKKIVFCDGCDRGFHYYCVGLESMPTGTWVCDKFCSHLTLRNILKK